MKKKLAAILLATLLPLAIFTGCLEDDYAEIDDYGDYDNSEVVTESHSAETESVVKEQDVTPASLSKRSTSLSLQSDGSVSINRSMRSSTEKMGDENTWTIFVYLCGSDLESGQASGSDDIEEMVNASTDENVKFVIQTGGCSQWQSYSIASDKMQRYEICSGKINLVDEGNSVNMGETASLSDFLIWGINNYPAANMGVIMWDHGSGSVNGVCFDENYNYDSLSISELDEALTKAYAVMTDKFVFIGFDACLMASIETANILVPHAEYMYASEETEPGFGWDYTAIGSYISKTPDCNGAELGKVVADSFYQDCKKDNSESTATFSIIDLSGIDNVVTAFNSAASNIYEITKDSSALGSMVREITHAKNYGGNSRSEGYTNMVDLGELMKATSSYANGSDEVISAIEKCVVYNIFGSKEVGSCGLSVYYPLGIEGSSELSIFKDICVSPYYMTFIDKIAYGASTGGKLDDYSGEDTWLGDNSEFWGDDDYTSTYWDNNENDNESMEQAEDSYIEYEVEPDFDENGSYGFTLTQDSVDNTAGIYCCVLYDSDDGYYYNLGTDNYVDVDWDTGEVSDLFDGSWYILDDGQLLCVYIVQEEEDYCIMTSPILLNGKETNLRILCEYGDEYDTISILGAWDGINENGSASREVIELKKGDVINPVYSVFDYDGNYIEESTGDDFVYNGDNTVYIGTLPSASYDYCFEIDDIFGNYYYTPSVEFYVDEDGEIYYS